MARQWPGASHAPEVGRCSPRSGSRQTCRGFCPGATCPERRCSHPSWRRGRFRGSLRCPAKESTAPGDRPLPAALRGRASVLLLSLARVATRGLLALSVTLPQLRLLGWAEGLAARQAGGVAGVHAKVILPVAVCVVAWRRPGRLPLLVPLPRLAHLDHEITIRLVYAPLGGRRGGARRASAARSPAAGPPGAARPAEPTLDPLQANSAMGCSGSRAQAMVRTEGRAS